VLFYKILFNSANKIEISTYYKDIKADYRGTAKGHLTLIPQLYTDSTTTVAYMNNYVSYLNTKIIEMLLHKDLFQKDLTVLADIKKNVLRQM
jgi:hypothetical protein